MRIFTRKLFGILIATTITLSGLSAFSGTVNADTTITLSGTCHVQDYGDTEGTWDVSTGILTLGTRGQSKRVEAITINLENNTGLSGTLEYRVHVQDIGWQDYRTAGEMAGTSGQAKRLEGIEMNLTGDLATAYTVEYAVHIQDYGDAQGFVSDGTLAGTTGESKRLEEVRVRIVPRGQGTSTTVNYRVHRQDYGWESVWNTNGQESGTTGQSKRLEGIEIHLSGNQYSGGIRYKTHVQNIEWEANWSQNGEMSGTQGLSYRLEAIQIELTGDIANYYDVYYRVHAQDYGWLGWAKNGETSGTSGLAKRLEAIQIVLVAKGGAAPGVVNGISSITNAISVCPDGYVYASDNAGTIDPQPASNPGNLNEQSDGLYTKSMLTPDNVEYTYEVEYLNASFLLMENEKDLLGKYSNSDLEAMFPNYPVKKAYINIYEGYPEDGDKPIYSTREDTIDAMYDELLDIMAYVLKKENISEDSYEWYYWMITGWRYGDSDSYTGEVGYTEYFFKAGVDYKPEYALSEPVYFFTDSNGNTRAVADFCEINTIECSMVSFGFGGMSDDWLEHWEQIESIVNGG